MKKLYPAFIFSILLLTGCKKDLEDKLAGTWNISDTKRLGIGGDLDHLSFKAGRFTFYDNGKLDYISPSNVAYKGSWDIETHNNDQSSQSLHITAVDFNTQEILTEFYDEIRFESPNHFKVTIRSSGHSYVTHFRR